MARLLNPQAKERSNLFFVILVVYLGHGRFRPVSSFIFLLVSFLGEVLISQIEETSEKNWCTSIVARVSSRKYIGRFGEMGPALCQKKRASRFRRIRGTTVKTASGTSESARQTNGRVNKHM